MLSPCTGARAAVDLLIGFDFLFGPELRITLWPAPLPPVLMRFIGPVVLGNDAGAWMVARQCSWEGARTLVAVAPGFTTWWSWLPGCIAC